MNGSGSEALILLAAGVAALGMGTMALKKTSELPQNADVEEAFIDAPQSFWIEDRNFMNTQNAKFRDTGLRLAGLADESRLLATRGIERKSDRILASAGNTTFAGGQTPQIYSSYTQMTGSLPAQPAKLTSGPYSDADFLARPEFKPSLPPRMYGGDFNAELRGALPPPAMMASPRGPMDFEPGYLPSKTYSGPSAQSQTTQEYFSGPSETIQHFERDRAQTRAVGNAEHRMNADYLPPVASPRASTDFASMAKLGSPVQSAGGMSENQANEDIYAGYINPLEYQNPQDVLPSDDMSSVAYGKLPSDPNTYVYDRLIVTNQRRRNLEGADWIRGDLPIAPDNRGWFQVSARPHLDLRQGAIGFQIGPDYNTIVESRDIAVNAARADSNVQVQRFN